VLAQLRERPVAAVQDQGNAVVLNEIAAARAAGVLPGRRFPEHGDPHRPTLEARARVAPALSALAQEQRRLARRHEPLRGILPERRARFGQVERAQLVAVEKAVGAGRFPLAAPLPLAPRQADGPQELLLPILYFDHAYCPSIVLARGLRGGVL
jgi:hypothetical protein